MRTCSAASAPDVGDRAIDLGRDLDSTYIVTRDDPRAKLAPEVFAPFTEKLG